MKFDYIIIGAGSAGATLAYRLSKNPATQVLLLEAGPADNNILIHVPKGIGKLRNNPKYLWFYQTENPVDGPVPETWIRGKTLGGSSSVNGMCYVRGQPEDFDGWEAAGNRGWGWSEMSKAFIAVERHELGADGVRGGVGLMNITTFPGNDPVCDTLINAGKGMNLSVKRDLNRPEQEGIGYLSRTIYKGRRVSTSTAFLSKAKRRKNLQIVTGILAERILFEGTRAVGVQCRRNDGSVTEYRANREVIVSAGAIESPKLLQQSGIGPAEHLQQFGIPVIANSPGVGSNFREHRYLLMQYKLKYGGYNSRLRGPGLLLSIADYVLRRRGLLANGVYDVGAFIKTRPELTRPNAQLIMAPHSFDIKSYEIQSHPGLQCVGYPTRPESQGTVRLRSNQPGDAPVIHPNYLTADADKQASVELTRYMRQFFGQDSLKDLIEAEVLPGKGVQTDDEIIEAYRRRGGSGYHGIGTCRMGSDSLGVVDDELRVKGLQGLRVIDASNMPTLVSGNTNAAVIAMAWRAADQLLSGNWSPA